MLTPLQRFFMMLEPNAKAIKNLYIFAIVSGIISLSLPLGIQSIINLIQGGEVSASWILLVSIVIFGYTFNGFLQIMQLSITEDLQKDIFVRSAFEFTYRLTRIKAKALFDHYPPELVNRFFDTISIQKGVSKILIDFSTSALQIFFGLILLSFYHPFFILFSLIVIGLVFIIGNYVFQRGLRSSVVESKYKYKVAFWLEEIAKSSMTFRLSSASPIPLNKTNSLVESYLTARDEHFKILVRQYYLFIIFKILVAAGFLFMGGILVFNQQMNIGQFVASEIIVLLLIASSEKLLLSLESVYDLLTSIEKIGQVTDMQLEIEGGYIPERTELTRGLAVGMNDIFFRYKDATYDNISGLTFEIGANERICISGSNTSGKSTLLKLLTGLYSPDRGSITFDDLPIKNYNLAHLRLQISMCGSEDRIFEGSIMDNLSLGIDIDMGKVSNVCEKILLLDFIKTLPHGYNTMIGPQGKKLSRSISQKISIVRNILKNPRLFLIEDFFSDIEKYEKIKIFQYLLRPEHNWTLIVISKDTEIIQMMNKVIEMDNGRIRAIINHKS